MGLLRPLLLLDGCQEVISPTKHIGFFTPFFWKDISPLFPMLFKYNIQYNLDLVLYLDKHICIKSLNLNLLPHLVSGFMFSSHCTVTLQTMSMFMEPGQLFEDEPLASSIPSHACMGIGIELLVRSRTDDRRLAQGRILFGCEAFYFGASGQLKPP